SQNWEHIRDVPCAVPVGQWIDVTVRMTASRLEVRVDDKRVLVFADREHPLAPGSIGLRTWKREASFRHLAISTGDQNEREQLPFRAVDPQGAGGVSGMWRIVQRGSARGHFALETERPFIGARSQRITFNTGEGSIGVENRGLNRWGLSFTEGKPYEGYLWMRADAPAEVHVAAESGGGARTPARP